MIAVPSDLRQSLHDLVRFAPEGETITLASGKQVRWSIDCSPVTFGDPVTVGFAIAEALTNAGVNPESFDAIGGPDPCGVPMAMAAGMTGSHRAFAIYLEDGIGTSGDFMGAVVEGDRVVLVDDLWIDDHTLNEAISLCVESGLIVMAALVLVYAGPLGKNGEAPTLVEMPTIKPLLPGQKPKVPFIPLYLPADIGVSEADSE